MRLREYPWWGTWTRAGVRFAADHVRAAATLKNCRMGFSGLVVVADFKGTSVTMLIKPENGLTPDCLRNLMAILLMRRGMSLQEVDAIDFVC